MPLLENLVSSIDQRVERRAFAATLLLHVGSKSGVEQLLSMLKTREGPVVHIAIALAKARVVEAREPLLDLIRDWNFRQDLPSGISLLDAFHSLGDVLPADISTKIIGQLDEPYRTAVAKLTA